MTYTPDGMLMTELANARRELQAMRGLVRDLADAVDDGWGNMSPSKRIDVGELIARAKAALSGDVP